MKTATPERKTGNSATKRKGALAENTFAFKTRSPVANVAPAPKHKKPNSFNFFFPFQQLRQDYNKKPSTPSKKKFYRHNIATIGLNHRIKDIQMNYNSAPTTEKHHNRSKTEQATSMNFEKIVDDRSNSFLIDHLNSILENENLINECARLSYKHQLGFTKYTIIPSSTKSSLRIHLWHTASNIPEDIHSHCAQFKSRIISGELVENSFRLTPGDEFSCFRYTFNKKTEQSSAIFFKNTNIVKYRSRRLKAGDIYTKKPGELHNFTTVTEGTLTISIWGEKKHEALVLKDIGACAKDCLAPTGISKEDFRQAIVNIKSRLSTQ